MLVTVAATVSTGNPAIGVLGDYPHGTASRPH